MQFADYLTAVRRHWRGVLAIVLATLAIAALITLLMPRKYSASASGMVQGGGSNASVGEASIADVLAKSRAKSYVDVAKSRAVAEQVIKDLSLPDSPGSLVSRVSVTQPVDTVLIRIDATAPSPAQASQLADAWVKALAEQVHQIENPDNGADNAMRVVPLEAAATPSAPSSPNPQLNLLLGLLAGAALGSGYAVVASRVDRKLRKPEDIEKAFDVTVAGVVPRSPEIHRERGDLVPIVVRHDTGRGSAVAESILKLRTNLKFMHIDKPPRVIS